MCALLESCTGVFVKLKTREVAYPGQVRATIQWTSTFWARANPKENAKVKVKEVASNRWNKGKGPINPKIDGTCHNCGKYKYKASDCWSNEDKRNDPKGKGNQAGSLDDVWQTQEPDAETG